MLKLRDVKLGAGRRSQAQSGREADLPKDKNEAAAHREAEAGGHVFPEREEKESERVQAASSSLLRLITSPLGFHEISQDSHNALPCHHPPLFCFLVGFFFIT